MAIKVYNLCCSDGHPFEGWFASGEDFDRQRERGLLQCPVCASPQIERRPSAPYLSTAATPAGDRQPTVMPSPEQLQAMFLRVAREIVAHTEDVGERFAEEARRIHYREAPERGIRGVATRAEAQELADEGITIMPLPFAHALKEPLQ